MNNDSIPPENRLSDADTIRDAERYRRLRVLGCAPHGSSLLDNGQVMRFTSLDKFVDHDLTYYPSRGESHGG